MTTTSIIFGKTPAAPALEKRGIEEWWQIIQQGGRTWWQEAKERWQEYKRHRKYLKEETTWLIKTHGTKGYGHATQDWLYNNDEIRNCNEAMDKARVLLKNFSNLEAAEVYECHGMEKELVGSMFKSWKKRQLIVNLLETF